ncbi:MAG TPA: hypothetical protein VF444_01515 [Pseudonocardiaceae bacterium]
MIIRILSEGQYEIPDSDTGQLNELDDKLMDAVESDDAQAFRLALGELEVLVRKLGTPVPISVLKPSDAVLPAEDAEIDEVRELLHPDGLLPG